MLIRVSTSAVRQLSDLTTQRVIIGVFLMLVLVPILSVSEENTVEEYSVDFLQEYNVNVRLVPWILTARPLGPVILCYWVVHVVVTDST